MTKTSGILPVLLVACVMLAAVVMPWVSTALPGNRGPGIQLQAPEPKAEAIPCCCGADEPCPCCIAATGKDKALTAAEPCADCRCGDNPAQKDGPGVFLLLTGVTPVGWRPPTPVEIITAPATPIASVCRILAGCLPVTNTAQRLALTGVRTT